MMLTYLGQIHLLIDFIKNFPKLIFFLQHFKLLISKLISLLAKQIAQIWEICFDLPFWHTQQLNHFLENVHMFPQIFRYLSINNDRENVRNFQLFSIKYSYQSFALSTVSPWIVQKSIQKNIAL